MDSQKGVRKTVGCPSIRKVVPGELASAQICAQKLANCESNGPVPRAAQVGQRRAPIYQKWNLISLWPLLTSHVKKDGIAGLD